ncbi:SH3 domain-containing protein [Winogradskyella endarachnes]|uniref:SH3 domain-containing protein n=1 Tax=Winogradskyella endarachnes TaxID=2681965 RepID=A0A6L6U4A1_9FLAO|nr:SH3 domain-containing protein [Winogradskyella endarachnes]MUU76871.1 SH3 domain-containing protein [Winogradskyella endarachnes]
MKKIILLVFFICNIVIGQNSSQFEYDQEFKINQTVFLFGDNVKLRNEPSTDAKTISLLKIGTTLKIIEVTDKTYLYNGIESPWYKVEYNDKQGYLVGGLISITEKKSNETRFLFSFKMDNSKLYVITRVLTNKSSDYLENITEFKGDNYLFRIFLHDNLGIENVNHILYFNYLPESCEANTGGFYLFLNDSGLHKVLDLTSSADIGFWESEILIFPNNPNGEKDKILFLKEHGQFPEDIESNDDPIWEETNSIKINLKWEDNKLTPNPRTILNKIENY